MIQLKELTRNRDVYRGHFTLQTSKSAMNVLIQIGTSIDTFTIFTKNLVKHSDLDLLLHQHGIHGKNIITKLFIAEREVCNIPTGHSGRHQLDEALEPRVPVEDSAAPVSRRNGG